MAANDLQQQYLEILAATPYLASVRKPGRTIVNMETFVYNAVIGTTALPLTLANGIQTTTLETFSDSDFVLTYLSASVNITANGDMKFNRNLTLQIQDTSTGKNFFNLPTVMTLVAGGGGFPFVYPAPRVINANVTLLLAAQNRDTAQDYNQMFVAMGGVRIFYAGGNR
jgi:hypothetical protein